MTNKRRFQKCLFQSTPPVWGATTNRQLGHQNKDNFNPRPPCGGRLLVFTALPVQGVISIHAPRVGGDYPFPRTSCASPLFQSTPPVWGATRASTASLVSLRISIHAPRVGGDDDKIGLYNPSVEFQSTPPVWGATRRGGYGQRRAAISIHAPRVGGDS